jgi:hypothetical protein
MHRVLALAPGGELPQPHLGDTEVEVCGRRLRGLAPLAAGADAATMAGRDTAGAASGAGRRRALTIGIDKYETQPLSGCVADARSAAAVLKGLGFDVQTLFDEAATRQGIATAIDRLLAESGPGDTVAVHYAGHGTQLPDLNRDDGFDEAWVPYDYPSGEFFIDDDQGELFDRYRAAGVELVLFTDCCHSGTNTRAAFTRLAPQVRANSRYLRPPPEAVRRFREKRSGGARAEAPATPPPSPPPPDALGWEIHFAACQDTQSAYEHDGHGDFTRALTEVLADAATRGASYDDLATKLAVRFAGNVLQAPNFRALAESRTRPVFGAGVRADAPEQGVPPAAASPWAASAASPDLERRLAALDAKLDALARKIDEL